MSKQVRVYIFPFPFPVCKRKEGARPENFLTEATEKKEKGTQKKDGGETLFFFTLSFGRSTESEGFFFLFSRLFRSSSMGLCQLLSRGKREEERHAGKLEREQKGGKTSGAVV